MTEKLQIKIQTCRHLDIDVDRQREDNVVYVNQEKKAIDALFGLRAGEAMCELTKKPCVLFYSNLNGGSILYNSAERCPAFQKASQRYVAEGKKTNKQFQADRIEEAD